MLHMIDYLPKLSLSELNDLLLCETKRFVEGLDNKIPHNELMLIRKSVKMVMEEIEKRKKIKC